jgi:acetyl esterase/lipase
MTLSSRPGPHPPIRRVAELQLRGPAGPLPARVCWPVPSPGAAPPPLLVFHPGDPTPADDDGALCRGLCAHAGFVVLWTTAPATLDGAAAATAWAADHAAELDADPARLLVGGRGAGAGRAAHVAVAAREEGWPVLTRQLLVLPEDTPEAVPAGVAPAVLVANDGYATRLRSAGVPVAELRHPPGRPLATLPERLAALLRDAAGDAA